MLQTPAQVNLAYRTPRAYFHIFPFRYIRLFNCYGVENLMHLNYRFFFNTKFSKDNKILIYKYMRKYAYINTSNLYIKIKYIKYRYDGWFGLYIN